MKKAKKKGLENPTNIYIFLPRLKLLRLSSNISHTAVLHDILQLSSEPCGRFDDDDDVDRAPPVHE